MSDRRMQSSRDERRQDRDDPRDRRDRRRSRSPGYRGNRREHEVDRYSSSRDFREREREDRYNDRRGGGGDWDYDRRRGGNRRDDDDRRRGGDHRRDRGGERRDDLFSDRRRGPRDDHNRRDGDRARGDRDGDRDQDRDRGRDRDDMRQLERQAARRSASPDKPREPTPDLDGVTSILQRARRMTQWDIKPLGYENVSAETAKLSGMFPLPGAPRQQPMDASRLQAFMNQPGNQASSTALKPNTSRQSKRLIVTNVTAGVTEAEVVEFFNRNLNNLNITRGRDPCIEARINAAAAWFLVEFKTNEDATMALALDGIQMDSNAMDTSGGVSNGDSHGIHLKRPTDYIAPAVQDESENESDSPSNVVPDTQNKIAITNIPKYIDEEQLLDLIQTFGPLKNFILVKDNSTGTSIGIAFCEYKNVGITGEAIKNLDNMELGDSHMRLQRASVGHNQLSGEISVNAMSMIAGSQVAGNDSSVLCLMNMITQAELMDTEEADEILEDVEEECQRYGAVDKVKMPRPIGGGRVQNGLTNIYVKFSDHGAASTALAALAGRKFADRTVVATYFPEEYFAVDAW